jgi:hypothetical protein
VSLLKMERHLRIISLPFPTVAPVELRCFEASMGTTLTSPTSLLQGKHDENTEQL